MNKPREQGEHVRLTSFVSQNLKKEWQTINVLAGFAEAMHKAKPVANVSERNAQTFIKERNAEQGEHVRLTSFVSQNLRKER